LPGEKPEESEPTNKGNSYKTPRPSSPKEEPPEEPLEIPRPPSAPPPQEPPSPPHPLFPPEPGMAEGSSFKNILSHAKLKLGKIEKFIGDSEKLDKFITFCSTYFCVNRHIYNTDK
jgi:hypothetical protein